VAATSQQAKFGFVEDHARDEAAVLADLDGEAVRGEGEGVLVLRERRNVRDAGTQRVERGVGAGEFEARVGERGAGDLRARGEGCGGHGRVRACDEGLGERLQGVCEMAISRKTLRVL
jgi:hypothetical protein